VRGILKKRKITEKSPKKQSVGVYFWQCFFWQFCPLRWPYLLLHYVRATYLYLNFTTFIWMKW